VTGAFFDGSPQAGAGEAQRLIEETALRTAVRRLGETHIRQTFSFAQYAASFDSMLLALGIRQPG